MTYREFCRQIQLLCWYYRGRFMSADPKAQDIRIWYGVLKDMGIERLKKVINFYALSHSEAPICPTDLLEAHRLLELAERALAMPSIDDLAHADPIHESKMV